MSGFKSFGRLFTAVIFMTMAACSSTPRVASSNNGEPAGVRFPDPASATSPEGRFVNLANLRKVQTGMTKRELYALLGTPQFDEGVLGVRRWNYLFKFEPVAPSVSETSCQYQVAFDADHHASAMYWKPAGCRVVLDRPVAVAELPAAPAPPGKMPLQPIRLSADALFGFDRSELTAQGRANLSEMLQQVEHASHLQNILIIGYADRLGGESHNLMLSKHRADSVARYLADSGVPAVAMTSAGRGSEDPVVQCSNAHRPALIDCLSPNRRVELSGAVDR